MENVENKISRPIKLDDQSMLFDLEPDWQDYWWGMPNFEVKDARPDHKITMNFMSFDDAKEFGEKIGMKITNIIVGLKELINLHNSYIRKVCF